MGKQRRTNRPSVPEDNKPQGPAPDDKSSQASSVPADGLQALIRHLGTTLGIEGTRFAGGLVQLIVNLCADGANFDVEPYKFLVAHLATSKPHSPNETILLQQMGTMHLLYMKYAKLLFDPANPVQAEMFVGMLTKMARTYLAQCEALDRSRGHNGRDQVIVRDVTQDARKPALETGESSTASLKHANGQPAAPIANEKPLAPVAKEKPVAPVNDGIARPRQRVRLRQW
jgi:hypothetical protein